MPSIKRFPFSDILGWSISRYDKFKICKRQYFYEYYPKFDKDNPIEKIQFLKKLTSRALETGNIVHDIVRDILYRYQKSVSPINKEKFIKYAYDLTQKYCGAKTFYESYYGSEVILPQEIFVKVKAILENFLNSARFKWIEENALETRQHWVIEPDGYGETRINEMKAFCKVDFLFPIKDKVYILDWKTGKQDEKKHSRQLVGYSLWASFHFEKSAEDIMPMIVYLFPDYLERSVNVTEDTINDFAESVNKETNEMYEYLTDIEKNIPKDKENFSKGVNKVFCKYCNYRELCLADKK
ncbi:MAG: PD-(D/E)XK nuclease family protein [Elusimicrobiota bacterium]|jgi:CRISPR/Cas system-associated exonuclease Cas4 (RecB family)|nr:PD-(D/E)XK nuclease family protein [Elusimicrobiota bacterium]